MERERDEERDEEAALERYQREQEELIGDTNENRNLSGSTTWETLPDQGPDDEDEDEDQPSV